MGPLLPARRDDLAGEDREGAPRGVGVVQRHLQLVLEGGRAVGEGRALGGHGPQSAPAATSACRRAPASARRSGATGHQVHQTGPMPSTTTTPAEPASRARDLLATAGRLVLTWVVLVALVLASAGCSPTRSPPRGRVGRRRLARIADERTPGLGEVADVGTLLADTPFGMAVAALSALAFAAWRRTWRPLVFVALVVAHRRDLRRRHPPDLA